MSLKAAVGALRARYGRMRQRRRQRQLDDQLAAYVRNGRRPWSEGYGIYKERLIAEAIGSRTTLENFGKGKSPGRGYGEFVDERAVEYPWLFSRLSREGGRLLDAGSVLNFGYLLEHDFLRNKEVTIATLEPEENCYWRRRISYAYCDLREMPFRSDLFDEVVSLSTIEHIGMNNAIYSANPEFMESDRWAFLKAVGEMKRVVRGGGKVSISVPYGKRMDFGWYQQFDAEMIEALIVAFGPARVEETYFAYGDGGWDFSTKEEVADAEGFNIHETKYFKSGSGKDYDPDFAACSRGIAALELWK